MSSFANSRSGPTAAWGAVNLAIATVIGISTARYLGPAERGSLAIAISTAGLVVLVGALGTNVAVRRLLPREVVTRRDYLVVSGKLFVPFVVLLGLVIVLLAVAVDSTLGQPAVAAGFMLAGATYFWSNQLVDLLNAQGLVATAARTNAGGTAVTFVVVAISVVTDLGLPGVLAAYAVGWLVQGLICWRISRDALPSEGRAARGRARELLAAGPRLMGLNLGQAVAYRADSILIGALSTPAQVGQYAVATTPAAALRLPSTAVGQVVMHDLASGKVERVVVWRRVLQVELLLIPLAAVGWLVADPVIPFFFGTDFQAAVGPFRVLLLAELALAPFLVLGRAIVGSGGTWAASFSGAVGAFALLAAGAIMIPGWGAMGAAWASVIAYGSMSIVAAIHFHRRSRLGRNPLQQ